MSRSRRKTPIAGNTCCETEKKDKERWHKKLRRRVHRLLQEDAESQLPTTHEASNPCKFGKDGKSYVHINEIKIFVIRK